MNNYNTSLALEAKSKKAGMTLGELRNFCIRLDAMEFDDDQIIRAGVGIKGQLKKIEVK